MKHLTLSSECFIKKLEKNFIYNREKDDLYEIDDEGLEFLLRFLKIPEGKLKNKERRFVQYLMKEKILIHTMEEHNQPDIDLFHRAPLPSLRYLELQLTKRCNLCCKHCYLGRAENIEIPLKKAIEVVKEFERMQGLKLLVSGGEPLLYSKFKDFNEFLKGAKLRRVLITNGITLSDIDCKLLNFDEVQVSVDGLEWSHDKLRGKGTFKKTLNGIERARKAGIQVSIATMITSLNINEFGEMNKLFRKLKVKSWGIDQPCLSGFLNEHPDLLVKPEIAARAMRYSFGGGYHGSDGNYICGHHLLTIAPHGAVAKCGFYLDEPYGNIHEEPLEKIWARAVHWRVSELKDCKVCRFLEACAGGCRFRASSPTGRDRVMCYFYGMEAGDGGS